MGAAVTLKRRLASSPRASKLSARTPPFHSDDSQETAALTDASGTSKWDGEIFSLVEPSLRETPNLAIIYVI